MQDTEKPVKLKIQRISKKPRVVKPKAILPETFGPLIPYHVSYNYCGFIYKITLGDQYYVGKKAYRKGKDWKTYTGSGKAFTKLLKLNSKKKVPVHIEFIVLAQGKNEQDLSNLETFHIRSAWTTEMESGNISNNHNYDDGTGRVSRRAWCAGWVDSKSANRRKA